MSLILQGVRPRHLDWWSWVLTVVLLAAGLSGRPAAFRAAVALSAWQIVHFAWRTRSLGALPVQVRIGYTILLGISIFIPWLFWLPAIGTTALVTVGYCPLARFLLLMPWNRRVRLSPDFVGRVFLSPPGPGSILRHPRLEGMVRTR